MATISGYDYWDDKSICIEDYLNIEYNAEDTIYTTDTSYISIGNITEGTNKFFEYGMIEDEEFEYETFNTVGNIIRFFIEDELVKEVNLSEYTMKYKDDILYFNKVNEYVSL